MNVLIRKHKYLLAYSLLFPISYLLLNYNKIFFNQVVYGMPTNILMICLTCLFLLFEILYLFDTTFDFMNLKYEIEIRKPNLLRDLIIKKSLISDIFLAVIQLISCYLFSFMYYSSNLFEHLFSYFTTHIIEQHHILNLFLFIYNFLHALCLLQCIYIVSYFFIVCFLLLMRKSNTHSVLLFLPDNLS